VFRRAKLGSTRERAAKRAKVRELRPLRPAMLQSCRQSVRSCVSRFPAGPSRLARRCVASTADDEAVDLDEALAPEALLEEPPPDPYAAYGRWFKMKDRPPSAAATLRAAAVKVSRKHQSRQLLKSAETADAIVRAWDLHKRKNLQIIEIYAGPFAALKLSAEPNRRWRPHSGVA